MHILCGLDLLEILTVLRFIWIQFSRPLIVLPRLILTVTCILIVLHGQLTIERIVSLIKLCCLTVLIDDAQNVVDTIIIWCHFNHILHLLYSHICQAVALLFGRFTLGANSFGLLTDLLLFGRRELASLLLHLVGALVRSARLVQVILGHPVELCT